jgi:hypothetical protein
MHLLRHPGRTALTYALVNWNKVNNVINVIPLRLFAVPGAQGRSRRQSPINIIIVYFLLWIYIEYRLETTLNNCMKAIRRKRDQETVHSLRFAQGKLLMKNSTN